MFINLDNNVTINTDDISSIEQSSTKCNSFGDVMQMLKTLSPYEYKVFMRSGKSYRLNQRQYDLIKPHVKKSRNVCL